MRKLALLPILTLALACNDGTIMQPEDDLTVAAARPPSAGKPAITFAGLRGSGCGLAQPWLEWEAVAQTHSSKLTLLFRIWRQDSTTPVYSEVNTGYPPPIPKGYYSVRHQLPVVFGVPYRMTAELFGKRNKLLDSAVTTWVTCPTPPGP